MGKLEFKAMTLIETIVAMVLITITFGIGIMIYSNISSNHSVPKKVKVDQLVQQIRDEMVEKEAYQSDEFDYGDFSIISNVKLYRGTENVYQLTFDLNEYKNNSKKRIYSELIYLKK